MKISILSLLLTFIPLTWASDDCLNEYKEASKKKHQRYTYALERFQRNRNASISNVYRDQFTGSLSGSGLVGSAYLQNATPPKKEDYNFFEDEIILAVEFNLDANGSKPALLESIYDSALEKYADVSYQKIQNLVLEGFISHKFCGFLGKTRPDGVERYVLKRLKESGSDVVSNRNPAVIDEESFKEVLPSDKSGSGPAEIQGQKQ